LKIKQLREQLLFRNNKLKELDLLLQDKVDIESENVMRDILEVLPGDFETRNKLADLFAIQGKSVDANMEFQTSVSLEKSLKDRTQQAIEFAMKSDWLNAIDLNKMIVEQFPWEFEAYNRLGKALYEQGAIPDALSSFNCALLIMPSSKIAQKNVGRINKSFSKKPKVSSKANIIGKTFIRETGKTSVTKLVNIPLGIDLSTLIPGHEVLLSSTQRGVTALDQNGIKIGNLDPKVGLRLSKLMRGGNKYEANITQASDTNVSVIIRETYQHPNQTSKSSFPSELKGLTDFSAPIMAQQSEEQSTIVALKDWSDDDTESGDEDILYMSGLSNLREKSALLDDDY
jgi:tetratricopeptide (TPR) repeat protein